jgi:hypothetical protein
MVMSRQYRRDPRVVVLAKPGGGPLADRARLRPVLARSRVRRAEIPDVTLTLNLTTALG